MNRFYHSITVLALTVGISTVLTLSTLQPVHADVKCDLAPTLPSCVTPTPAPVVTPATTVVPEPTATPKLIPTPSATPAPTPLQTPAIPYVTPTPPPTTPTPTPSPAVLGIQFTPSPSVSPVVSQPRVASGPNPLMTLAMNFARGNEYGVTGLGSERTRNLNIIGAVLAAAGVVLYALPARFFKRRDSVRVAIDNDKVLS